jgi:hypothetical protein
MGDNGSPYPLSPFIFNAVLEPLLLQLEEMNGYRINNDTKVSSLAFADDLILVSSERGEDKILFQKTEKYVQGLGMGISAPKCATFSMSHQRLLAHRRPRPGYGPYDHH